jgi:hypothetical protein
MALGAGVASTTSCGWLFSGFTGAEAADAAPPDTAARDGAPPDTAAEDGDAPLADAAAGDGATSLGFCAAHDASDTVFCDDFDDPTRSAIIDTGWVYADPSPGAFLDKDASASPPASALLLINVDGGTGGFRLSKIVPFPPERSMLVVSAKLFVESGSDPTLGILLGNSKCEVLWNLLGKAQIDCDRRGQYLQTGEALATDQWVPIQLTIVRTASEIDYKYVVNPGAPTFVPVSDHFTTDAGWTLTDGFVVTIGSISPPRNGVIHIDDVLVQEH